MSDIDYDDKKTWHLFKDGRTKGVFQLESNLGKSWSKKLAPSNLEELAALIALIRPGCLKAISEGKSMTQHYADRKSKKDDVVYLHESLEDILKPTYGVLVYQEQSMRIAQKLAGFDLREADKLRKAIGKKKADLMAKVKEDFLAGCETLGIVDHDTALEIFSWIEKSSRYSFNKSHAVAYAMNSYWSAWYKANYTKEFFLSYFFHAADKQDPHQEVYELLSEAKLFDLEVKIPNVSRFSSKFQLYGNKIQFGIKDIKSLTGVTGDKVTQAVSDAEEELNKKPTDFNWMDIVIYLSPKINSAAFKALCSIGFFSTKATNISRNKALYEYLIFRELTKAEVNWVAKNYADKQWATMSECFRDLAPTKKTGGGTSKIERSQIVSNEADMLDNPPYDLSDDPSWIIDQEAKFLGCPVSLSRIESSDTSTANTSCKDITNGKTGQGICVAANINRLATHKVKKGKTKGKTMAFLTIEDETCSLDSVVVFPEAREKHQYILFEGNNLLFCGSVKKDSSFIIEKIHEI
jgi:DNA polymerase III alpha subunit